MLAKQRFKFSSYFDCVFCEFGGYVAPSVKASDETTRCHIRNNVMFILVLRLKSRSARAYKGASSCCVSITKHAG